MSAPRILVLAKKSALELHREGRSEESHERMEQLLAAHDPALTKMAAAHEQHEATIREVQSALDALGFPAQFVKASRLEAFRLVIDAMTQKGGPGPPELVITVGGDGTLLAASHAISKTPVLAINSAPDHSVGFFAGASLGTVKERLARALDGTLPSARLTRMEVLCEGLVLSSRVLNEVLLCAASPAGTSRYTLEHDRIVEDQKSSGVWIGPAPGSTAAQRAAGGRVLPLTSRKLQFVVREPYTAADELLRLPRGLVHPGSVLRVRNKMVDGRLFVDGAHQVHLLTFGDMLEFRESDEPLTLLGVLRRPGWTRSKARTASTSRERS